jgi:hypothetical protein
MTVYSSSFASVAFLSLHTKIWFQVCPRLATGRTYAIRFPSGENTHASGRGACLSQNSWHPISGEVSPARTRRAAAAAYLVFLTPRSFVPVEGLDVDSEDLREGLLGLTGREAER